MAVELDPSFAIANRNKASYIYEHGFGYDAAVKASESAMLYRNRLFESSELTLRALDYNIRQEPQNALSLLRMQDQIYPNNYINKFYLFRQYDILNQPAKMLEMQKQINEIVGDLNSTKYDLAYTYNRNRDYKQAVKILEEVFTRNPKSARAILTLASQYLITKEIDKAKELYNKALILFPERETYISRLIEVIDFLKTKRPSYSWFKQFEGRYRNDLNGERVWLVKAENNSLFFQTDNCQLSNYWHPLSEDEFTTRTGYTTLKFIRNSQGKIIKREVNDRNEKRTYDSWKQDSLIQKAERLIRKREYTLLGTPYSKVLCIIRNTTTLKII